MTRTSYSLLILLSNVEVNSNDFHNPGCYVYGSPAKSAFEFAVIFAANINAVNGQATLYFNPQVQNT